MKKILLASLLVMIGVAASWAEDFNYGTLLGGTVYEVGTTKEIPGITLYDLGTEEALAAISYSGTGDFTVPEKVDFVMVTNPENGDPQTLRVTFTVVQINEIKSASKVVIPGSVQTIAPGAFAEEEYWGSNNYVPNSTFQEIVFEAGDEPLEIYPCSAYGQKFTSVTINR